MIMKLIVLIRANSTMKCNISKNYVAISKDIKILKLWLWWILSLISFLHKIIPCLIAGECFLVRMVERTIQVAIIKTIKMSVIIIFHDFFLRLALVLMDQILFINSCSAWYLRYWWRIRCCWIRFLSCWCILEYSKRKHRFTFNAFMSKMNDISYIVWIIYCCWHIFL